MTGDFTVGVEEEYQVVDPATWDLRDGAADVLAADWSEDVRKELHQSTLEIGTTICRDAEEAGEALKRLRFQVGAIAASEGLRIAAAGLHPFSRWEGRSQMEAERYQRLVERYGRVSRDEHNFGMHIHIAVPDPDDRLRVLNDVRQYMPHLLALSCSSPYFEGSDTGYSSYRMVLWSRWPLSGVPPRFSSPEEHRRFRAMLLATGAIADEGSVYWSVRPHHEYDTVEFRITDVCPSVEDATAIAALTRALVAAAAEGVLPSRCPAGLSPDLERELIATDTWRASRFGLECTILHPERRSGIPMRDAIEEFLAVVEPVASRLGDAEALAGVGTILARGNGASRMRAVYEDGGGLGGVVRWVVDETLLGTGIDRRAEQRSENQ